MVTIVVALDAVVVEMYHPVVGYPLLNKVIWLDVRYHKQRHSDIK